MAQENLKAVITLVAQAIAQGEKSFADGVQGKDFFDFFPEIASAGTLDWKQAFQELKTRDAASNDEILAFVKTTFPDQPKVIAAVSAVIAIDNVIIAFKPTTAPVPAAA